MQDSQMTRRGFLGAGGAGSLAILGTGLCTPEARAAAARVGPLKITKIEAVRFRRELRIQGISPDWTWVRLYTDQGIVGIGESYSGAGHESHVAVLKAYAPLILGKDAADIDRLWQTLFYQISYAPWGGAETRMLSALNIAQWDILGKASGLPVYRLLGGKAQEKLQVYNTMNGWPINGMREHDAPEKLTEFLLSRGIKGIKIYPYDRRPARRHVHLHGRAEGVARSDRAYSQDGGR
jgi:galactonate dehydratase